ncbi:phage tail tape measure protein [Pseudomonas sp. NPDC098747]|uniref:phage tail tape measure protein n=1 Tax=Pseudomonas sp. NPDC098747 TaxID=3364487 RepID=UPI00383B7104
MAQVNNSLKFTEINQDGWASSIVVKAADLVSPMVSGPVGQPAMTAGQPSSGLAGAIDRLNLELSGATVELRQLTAEQARLRGVLVSIHSVLASQRSLQQAMSDRQAQPGTAAVGGEQKPLGTPAGGVKQHWLSAGVDDFSPFKPLTPAVNLDAAMAKLQQVSALESDQRGAHQIVLEKMATEAKVAAGGTKAAELAEVEYAGARAGIGNNRRDAEGNVNEKARREDLVEFTRDTAVTATAFKMTARDTADLLIGLRTSMSLDRPQTLDLADATSVLTSRLSVSPADIGSILGNYGASAKGAGMQPEQAAAFSAALIHAGVNRADAGVAFEKITTTLAQGDQASTDQKAAMVQLGLNPKSLAADMQSNAPDTILKVLKALSQQSADQQSKLATTLFSVDQPIIKLLQSSGDVQRAFELVKTKKDYATSQRRGEPGAVDQAALIQADTSQARLNILNAQKERLYTSAGAAVLPAFDYLVAKVGQAADDLSNVAEEAPQLTSALILSIAGMKALKALSALGPQVSTWVDTTLASVRSGLGSFSARAGAMGTAVLNRARFMASGSGRSLISRGARLGRVAGPLGMPLMMLDAGMKVVQGVAEGDTKKIAGGLGTVAGGLAGGYAGASIGATIGTFILPGIGTMIGGALGGAIGSFYGSQAGESLGEKLATPASDQLAPPAEVSAGLSSVQTQNQLNPTVTYAPAFHFSGGDLTSAEKVTAMVAQVMQAHFSTDFTPLMSTNPLATRRDAALTDGVA